MQQNTKALLLEAITNIVMNIPQKEIDYLIDCLESNDAKERRGMLASLARTQRTRSLYSALDVAWNASGVEAGSLALALSEAAVLKRQNLGKEKITTVWTGPATTAVPLRRIEQVLAEIINGAKKDLLIVSFVVYKVKEVMVAIQSAMERKINVSMILETEKESEGKVSFDQVAALKKSMPKINIYTWPLSARPKNKKKQHGAIHAKCAVADRSIALVSSANLTDFALEMNMELGVLIDGGDNPRAIADHFQELITRRILEPVHS